MVRRGPAAAHLEGTLSRQHFTKILEYQNRWKVVGSIVTMRAQGQARGLRKWLVLGALSYFLISPSVSLLAHISFVVHEDKAQGNSIQI